jgi:hypothetical protein
MWPQGVLHESVVIICRVCTHILEEVVLAKSNITILHDMGTVGRIVIGSPPFYLHMHHNEIIWLCRQIKCHVCSLVYIQKYKIKRMACKHLPVHIAGAEFLSVNCVCHCSQGQIINFLYIKYLSWDNETTFECFHELSKTFFFQPSRKNEQWLLGEENLSKSLRHISALTRSKSFKPDRFPYLLGIAILLYLDEWVKLNDAYDNSILHHI